MGSMLEMVMWERKKKLGTTSMSTTLGKVGYVFFVVQALSIDGEASSDYTIRASKSNVISITIEVETHALRRGFKKPMWPDSRRRRDEDRVARTWTAISFYKDHLRFAFMLFTLGAGFYKILFQLLQAATSFLFLRARNSPCANMQTPTLAVMYSIKASTKLGPSPGTREPEAKNRSERNSVCSQAEPP